MKPKSISTFAGCGGSSLGYEQAGIEVACAVEWDKNSADCYALNHPHTKMFFGDIAKVSSAELMDAAGVAPGELFLLDGSPPCQGFSTAGRRVIDDPRNSLFREQIRLIHDIRPQCVVIENVSGMIKGKMKRVAGEIISALKGEGYQVTAGLIQATAFGVPQTRPRIFFVGARGFKPTLPKPTHTSVIFPEDALLGVEPGSLTPSMGKMRLRMGAMLKPGEDGNQARKGKGLAGDSCFGDTMIHPRRPAQTIRKTVPFGGYWHWSGRHLSIEEALVLTGFPPYYKLIGSFAERWARIGNSVAPPMTKAIGLALIEQARTAGVLHA